MWFYTLPVWFTLPTFILLFVGVSWAMLLALRPWVKQVALRTAEWDRVIGHAFAMYGVFYGITLALVAVSVFQNFIRVDQVVQDEVATLAAFFRTISGLPEPVAGDLQALLRVYTGNVILVDWPLQASGSIPTVGAAELDQIQRVLFGFQAKTQNQAIIQSVAIEQYGEFVNARRYRINETRLSLPALLWALLWVGAVLNQILISLIEVKEILVHLIISGLISLFVAMLIYVTLALDHPFYGGLSISPIAFETLLTDTMRPR